MKRNSTISSINNDLYSVVEADGNLKAANTSMVDKPETSDATSNIGSYDAREDLNARTRSRKPVDRTSGSSDEVFTDCPGCVNLLPDGQCIKCGVRNVSILSPGEANREDSGFGSTNSDDSNRNCLTDNDSDSSSFVRSDEDTSIADSDNNISETKNMPDSTIYGQPEFEVNVENHCDTNLPDFSANVDSFYLSLSSRIYEEDGTWTVSSTRV